MITQAAQVKCFPLSQKQLLISGPCLQTLAHISYFLLPVFAVSLSLTRCSQRGWCSPQCAACSMVDVTEPATRRDLRERRIEVFVAATIKSFIAGTTRLPPHPHPAQTWPLNDSWGKMRGGGVGGRVIASLLCLGLSCTPNPDMQERCYGRRRGQCLHLR